MRLRSQISKLFAGLLCGFALACQGTSGRSLPPAPPVQPDEGFSSERAWAHLEALSSFGSRASGSEGIALAREYVQTQLEEVGLEVESIEFEIDFDSGGQPVPIVHLLSVIEGASSDEIVLVTPYDSGYYESFAFAGANEGASGAALLLELARVLKLDPLPYSVRLVFLDGEGRFGRGEPQEVEVRYLGSSALAQIFAERGWLSRVRLLVMLDRVGDADLRIARDLGSHRYYREEFWEAARDLGYTEIFPRGAAYETVIGSHLAFGSLGLRRIVAISDTSFGGDEPPGIYAGTEEDTPEHCSPESLDTIGRVTLRALDVIGTRLAKIDRFAELPVVEPDESAEPEVPEEAEGAGDAVEGAEDAAEPAAQEAAAEEIPEPPPAPLDEAPDPPELGSGSP